MSKLRAHASVVVPLRASRCLNGAALALLAAVAGVAAAAPSAAWMAVALALGTAVLVEWRAARSAAGETGRVRVLERDGVGRWWLHRTAGGRTAARLRGAPFVSVPLVVLAFDADGRREVLALFPDSADPQALRRLRTVLRLAAGAPARHSVSSGGA